MEEAVKAIAMGQHGVFGLRQILAVAGISRQSVGLRARSGRLHRLHHGVYSLVPAELLTSEGHRMAAVLACGPEAALSVWSAAAHRKLLPSRRTKFDVTVPTRGGRIQRPRIRIHRSGTLRPCDVELLDGIPTTTVARTIFDIADDRRASPRQIEKVLDEAEYLEVLDTEALLEQIEHNRGRPLGVRRLRGALETHTPGSTRTDGPLGELGLKIIRSNHLPAPKVEFWIDLGDGGPMIRADFAWPEVKVMFETDGRRAHSSPNRRRRDKHRDERARRAGWDTVRATGDQMREDPAGVGARLSAVIARDPGSARGAEVA